MCNLESFSGGVVYRHLYKDDRFQKLLPDFYQHFEEDIFTKGGSCLPIKSAITRFTISGLCGLLAHCTNALFSSPFMPTLAKRMWLITRRENVRLDEDGKLISTT
jgi:hypothetical protein